MNNIYKRLEEVDWDFPDYISSSYPNDINSIHWYPAAFVPQIPSILTQLLSNEGDVTLEPFVGSGVTIIEAIKLNRKPIGVDLNPYAIEITQAKLSSIQFITNEWKHNEIEIIKSLTLQKDNSYYIYKNQIDNEVLKWYDPKTLNELVKIHDYIINKQNEFKGIRKIIFSSILNRCCSQRDHYTYITDRCYPKNFIYYNVFDKFIEQIENVSNSAIFFRDQFFRLHECEYNFNDIILENNSSINLGWLKDSSVDLIVTSPPYLGVNDYIRSIRLTSLFFPNPELESLINNEIGARRKRSRKNAYDEYMAEMKLVFKELNRVLKSQKYLCLVMGQSSGKVTKENIIDIMVDFLTNELDFELIFKKSRHIKFRRIQVAGIGNEWIIVLKSNKL